MSIILILVLKVRLLNNIFFFLLFLFPIHQHCGTMESLEFSDGVKKDDWYIFQLIQPIVKKCDQ